MADAKSIALTVSFAGIAIVLNPAISGIGIPFPPVQSLIFNIWEIPVIAVFLLFGFRFGMSVAAINALFLFAVWPGPARGPFYAVGTVFSAFSMMLGIFVMFRIFGYKIHADKLADRTKLVTAATVFALFLRIVVLAPYMFLLLRSVYGVPDPYIVTIVLPWQAVYNVAQPLITIPLAFVTARGVYRNLKLTGKLGLSSMLT
jgi:riboflavin transporter FmnP